MKMFRFRSLVALSGLLAAVLVAAGCGTSSSNSSNATSGTATNAAVAFHASAKAGVKGSLLPQELKLWVWRNGAFHVATGDASKQYVPDIRKAPKPYTFAYADGWGANQFSVSIRKSIYRLAKQMGIKIIYCDNQFKTDQAITCAEELSAQHPDFAIDSNWQGGVAKQVMAIWDKAKIPVATVDVWHPGAIFFGANNYESGLIGGKAAGQYAKQKGACKDAWVLLGEHKEEGASSDLRLTGFSDGVQEVCGKLPSSQISRVLMDAGTADQAITKTTDWLTGHPQAKLILATSLDDERASGIAKALVASNRNGQAVGQGCDVVGITLVKNAPAAKNKYLGCVAFFPEKYPNYLMSVGLDVLAGKPVPQEVHIVHKFLTHDTISKYYP